MKKTTNLVLLLFLFFVNTLFAQTTTQITTATGNQPTAGCLDPNGDIWTLEKMGTNDWGVVQYDASNNYARIVQVATGLSSVFGDRPSDIESASNGDIFYIDAYTANATDFHVYMLDASNSYSKSTLLSNVVTI